MKPDMRFINKLKASLRASPERYYQDSFVPVDEDMPGGNVCGGAFCIAGHAFLLTGKTMKQLVNTESETIQEKAAAAMRLPETLTERLFDQIDAWPDEFIPSEHATAKRRVELACKHIDAVVEVALLLDTNPVLRDELGSMDDRY